MKIINKFKIICFVSLLLAGCAGIQRTESEQRETAQINKDILRTAEIISVYDGDTIKVRLQCSEPLFCSDLPIRIAGIDTPELRTKDTCEKVKAQQAKEFASTFLKAGKLELKNCKRGKYFRLVCDVYINGQSLSNALIQQGLAYEYDGGTKFKINWCE